MDFTNLSCTFLTDGETQITKYYFGRSTLEIKSNKEDHFVLEYINDESMKLNEDSDNVPWLYRIYIKRLWEAFNITSRDIESLIKSLQAWKRRKQEKLSITL